MHLLPLAAARVAREANDDTSASLISSVTVKPSCTPLNLHKDGSWNTSISSEPLTSSTDMPGYNYVSQFSFSHNAMTVLLKTGPAVPRSMYALEPRLYRQQNRSIAKLLK